MAGVHDGLVVHSLSMKGGVIDGIHDGDVGGAVNAIVMLKFFDGEGDANGRENG